MATYSLTTLMALCLAVSANAQTTPDAGQKPRSDDDILVIGNRGTPAIEHQHAAEYVRTVSQIPVSGQYARWHDPVCLRVDGIDPSAAQLVETSVKRIAADAGVRVGLKGCRPNFVILFTRDGDATLKNLERRRLAYPSSVSLAERRTIRVPRQPVRWWVDTEIQGADGEPLASSPSPAVGNINLPVNDRTQFTSTYSSSIIQTKVRATIASAVVLVDVAAAAGRRLTSIADYTAFMVLGRARPVTGIAIPTIARLFDSTCDNCTGLTAADHGYLRGLYRLPINRPANVIRSALTGRVATGR